MAQALFDEHPLEAYLREAGEMQELMPGACIELERENKGMEDLDNEDSSFEVNRVEKLPRFIIRILELIRAAVQSSSLHSNGLSPFAERFKYNVISSSLLATTLPGVPTARTQTSIPGKLDHSRSSSLDEKVSSPSTALPPNSTYGVLSVAVLFAAALFSAGYPSIAIMLLGTSILIVCIVGADTEAPERAMMPSLEALEDLIASNGVWESVVQEAVSALENDDGSNVYGTPGSSPTSSSLRVALHSSLQTTQSQCDNVRNLFTALTCPAELSQLSEMYAPPSPLQPTFDASRHASLPSRRRAISVSSDLCTTPENKRATWNGSSPGLAGIYRTPMTQVYRRREKRRSQLSSVLQPIQSSSSQSVSAPVTPTANSSVPSTPLDNVQEDASGESENESTIFSPFAASNHFGAAALDLQRKRKSGGIEAFQPPPPGYFTSSTSPKFRRFRNSLFQATSPTISSSSRFTSMQTSRHPLSLSAMQNALQGALWAKRYACSHLLALRFNEEDGDEAYWEDVRSVISLLASTLGDASSRLADALEDVGRRKTEEQIVTPDEFMDEIVTPFGDDNSFRVMKDSSSKRRNNSQRVSFAPMPSHLSRFAAHVASIHSALDDARDHLEECVDTLQNIPSSSQNLFVTSTPPRRLSKHSYSRSSEAEDEDPSTSKTEPPALQAYERLRRELGIALRECERGREQLLEVIYPPKPPLEEDEEEDSDSVPGLAHDPSSDSDTKPDYPEDVVDSPSLQSVTVVGTDGVEGSLSIDDATSHLLLAASAQHLPPPGIEQVFEADTGSGVLFARERSKLTREERIKLVKARRESGLHGAAAILAAVADAGPYSPSSSSSSPSSAGEKRGIERWGPGGEVVQELKDVIWKVSERRRRRMVDGELESS